MLTISLQLWVFLPTNPSVHIIVTTRSATAQETTNLKAIEVGEIERGEAVKLFVRSAKILQYLTTTMAEIRVIVKEPSFLALAISLAGSLVSVTPPLRSDLRHYVHEYRQRRKDLPN